MLQESLAICLMKGMVIKDRIEKWTDESMLIDAGLQTTTNNPFKIQFIYWIILPINVVIDDYYFDIVAY